MTLSIGDVVEIRVTVYDNMIIHEDWKPAVIVEIQDSRRLIRVMALKGGAEKYLALDQRGEMWR